MHSIPLNMRGMSVKISLKKDFPFKAINHLKGGGKIENQPQWFRSLVSY